ncbi:uncharacterized protein [Heterodontus francisci]|uniref:uncharacterized protein isoform X2 n=1 Tax=Heterodontus francisci TaxID=7792 RepID=UPI00355B6C2C
MYDMVTLFCPILQLLLHFTDGQRIVLDLQQPNTLSVARGDMIVLNCSYSIPDLQRFEARWVFYNHDRRSPKIIANLSTNVPQVTHSRYSAMHNSSQKAFILRIADVQVSDSGTYCCRMFRTVPPPNVEKVGNGTLLNVTAYRFYPNIITMMFQATCLTSQLISESNTSNPDGTYNHTAIVNVSTENCTNLAEFTCIVRHPASQSKINHTILIVVRQRGEDRDGHLWIPLLILLSICGGTACIIPLALFLLIKCTCEKKGTQERKGTQASNRRLHRRQDNMDDSNGNNICYTELQLGNLQKVRKKEEEVVYSAVLC